MSCPLTYGVLAIRSETIEFDCIFSGFLVIQILTVYVGYNRFRFTVKVGCTWWNLSTLIENEKSYAISKTEFRKSLTEVSVNAEKKIIEFTNELELSQSDIWLTTMFDEFFVTSIKLGLTIGRLNHIVIIPKNSYFFVLLGCYYMLLGITGRLWELIRIIFGSTILVGLSQNYSDPSKRVLMILWWRSQYVLLPDRIESEG